MAVPLLGHGHSQRPQRPPTQRQSASRHRGCERHHDDTPGVRGRRRALAHRAPQSPLNGESGRRCWSCAPAQARRQRQRCCQVSRAAPCVLCRSLDRQPSPMPQVQRQAEAATQLRRAMQRAQLQRGCWSCSRRRRCVRGCADRVHLQRLQREPPFGAGGAPASHGRAPLTQNHYHGCWNCCHGPSPSSPASLHSSRQKKRCAHCLFLSQPPTAAAVRVAARRLRL